MFFKRRFLSLILALFLLAGLTSCGGPPEDAGSGPSASDLGQEAQPSDQPEDPSLSQLRRELDEGGYFCGIAFLGNLPDGDPEALPRVIREAGYLEDYPFLETLPKEQIIAYEGSEAYCPKKSADMGESSAWYRLKSYTLGETGRATVPSQRLSAG